MCLFWLDWEFSCAQAKTCPIKTSTRYFHLKMYTAISICMYHLLLYNPAPTYYATPTVLHRKFYWVKSISLVLRWEEMTSCELRRETRTCKSEASLKCTAQHIYEVMWRTRIIEFSFSIWQFTWPRRVTTVFHWRKGVPDKSTSSLRNRQRWPLRRNTCPLLEALRPWCGSLQQNMLIPLIKVRCT